MQFLKNLLYGLAGLAGVGGLVFGGCPMFAQLIDGVFLGNFVSPNDELFRYSVVFLLSLILLILVHLGYRLAGAFDTKRSKQPKPANARHEPVV